MKHIEVIRQSHVFRIYCVLPSYISCITRKWPRLPIHVIKYAIFLNTTKKQCLLRLTDYFNILYVLSQRNVWNKENTRRQSRFTFTSTAILNTISPIYTEAVRVGGSFQ